MNQKLHGENNESRFFPKELSWLSFNERVLQEATDPTVPIIQRIRYLGIFSNNMDEFFRVRVADVRRLAAFSSPTRAEPYRELLTQIQMRVLQLQNTDDRIYQGLLSELRDRNIHLIDEKALSDKQTSYVQKVFTDKIQPYLVPILLDDNFPLPSLNDTSIYLAIKLAIEAQVRYALLEIPTDMVDRFIQIPNPGNGRSKMLIYLDDVIRKCLPQVFRGVFPTENAEAYTFKVTRDAELELGEGISQSFIDKVSSSLKKRSNADPVRVVYDSAMPSDLLNYLVRRLGITKLDSVIPGGRYHNSKDLMNFPSVGPVYLDLKPLPAIPLKELAPSRNIFECIRERDVLLHYPYHPFTHIIDLLKTAAIDPTVKSIKISLYRVAANSQVVEALENAVRNHKQVTAILELRARFDEEANIGWARKLTDMGVNVIFGVSGIKVHSKLILIERQENNVVRYYSHIGTGNFNEKTARVYTDFSLLTYDQEIGEEVANVFSFLQFTHLRFEYRHLGVSPYSNRNGLVAMIDTEIEAAKEGVYAAIMLKCNNLVDEEVIDKLYEASQAGVRIRLIVRGMCALIAGRAGLSENIKAISIVDRFLEHPRVYVFQNRGVPRYYISSADLMTRNLDYRVEVSAPIYDKRLQKTLQDILDIQWRDNVKARILDETQSNPMRTGDHKARVRSQEAIHTYLAKGKLPRMKKIRLIRPLRMPRSKKEQTD